MANPKTDNKVKSDAQIIVARSAVKANDEGKARMAYANLLKIAKGELAAEALYYDAYFKNKDLKYNRDGSLTLYVQSEKPSKDKESNWLPAPKNGEFSLYIRAYWPKEVISNGQWTPPAVIKAK